MGKRWWVCLALALAALPASAQSTESSEGQRGSGDGVTVVVAAAQEESVVLPDAGGVSTGWLLGIGGAVALFLAGITVVHNCDDSSGSGCGPIQPTTTATR